VKNTRDAKAEEDLLERLGKLLKCLPNEHDKEYTRRFQLQHNTFFQKLIPTSVLENELEIVEDDYLKSLVSLEYLTNVIFSERKLIENLEKLQEVLVKVTKGTRRMDIGIISAEIGLYALDKPDLNKTSLSKIRERYNARNIAPPVSAKPAEPYYIAIAKMVYDLVSDENKPELAKAAGKNNLKALVFTDSMLSYIDSAAEKKKILKTLKDDVFNASVYVVDCLRKEASVDKLKKYMGVSDG